MGWTIVAMASGAGLAILMGQMKNVGVDPLVQASGDDDELPFTVDPHLPSEYNRAVINALKNEKDPRALRAFGRALFPDYPIPASALFSRATNLENGTLVSVHRKDSAGLSLNPFRAAKDVVVDKLGHEIEKVPVIKNVAHEVDKIHKNTVFGKIFDAYEAVGTLQPAVFGRMLQKHTAERALSGEKLTKVLDDTRKDAGHWAQNESHYVAMVPGIGTALAPVYSAAGAIALGEPVPQSIIDVGASALPGGPVVQGAARTGASFGLAMAQGQKPSQAALTAAREGLPPQARPAFDVGLSLAHGQGLQKIGFRAAADLLQSQGGSVAEKVLDATNLAPIVAQTGRSLEDIASERLGGQVAQIAGAAGTTAANVVEPLIKNIVANPRLARMSSVQLSRQFHVPEPVARAALASLKTAGSSFVINQARLHKLVGPTAPPAPRVADKTHVKLAVAAAKGNASAQKQLSFQAARSAANAESVDNAKIMAARALWAARYMNDNG
jgi:hypothetical protein